MAKRGRSGRRTVGTVAVLGAVILAGSVLAACSSSSSPAVLLVGTYHGHAGTYPSIQAAVDAAQPGDWILVAPGDYHETDDAHVHSSAEFVQRATSAAWSCTPPNVHLRGMNRDTRHRRRHQGRVVDPVQRGPAVTRTSAPVVARQGRRAATASSCGRPNDVSVENLTVCNFLGGAGRLGQRDLVERRRRTRARSACTATSGSYLTGDLDLLRHREHRRAVRDLLVQRRSGPATLEPDLREQHQRLGHVRRRLPPGVRHHHRPRLDGVQRPRLLRNQLGRRHRHRELAVRQQPGRPRHQHADRRRPAAARRTAPARTAAPAPSPTPTRAGSSCTTTCTTTTTPNVPEAGQRGRGPDRHRHDALGWPQRHRHGQHVRQQRRVGRRCSSPTPTAAPRRCDQTCADYGGVQISGLGCVFEPEGDALLDNTFVHNGFFGNPTNADFGQIVLNSGLPQQLLRRQHGARRERARQPGAAPADLWRDSRRPPTSTARSSPRSSATPRLAPCPAGANYPAQTGVHARARCPRACRRCPTPAPVCRRTPGARRARARARRSAARTHRGHPASALAPHAGGNTAYRPGS